MSGSLDVDGELRIVEVRPLDGLRTCIIGLPDVGLVGLITANHLINSLGLDEVGYLESKLLPPVIVVHNGEPKHPVRFFAQGGLVILTSEIPIPASILNLLADGLLDWASAKGFELLVSVSGIAVPNRLEIDTPEVYGVASSEKARRILEDSKIPLLEEGFMVGPHAAILRESLRRKVDSLILLAQSHYQYPDPGAAASVVNTLNKFLGLNVDVKTLLEQAEEIRLKTREIMQRTYKAMQRMQKMQEQELPPMYV
ncbi:MAG: proteasome assembly chaperone family protein [Candidatus Bathyarchaeia archaeon]|nr:proteasome assembly chaperone family protein [Candidatus Bathyarchaeota archaeon]